MKVGVVGYGSIGKRHVANLRKLGYVPAIYDPAYPGDIRFERTIYEMCDAVVIATPSLFHWGAVRACAERGRHMLVEKPIATGDVPGLQASLDLAASKNAIVMMGNNLRFHPCVIAAKNWLSKSGIGKPLWASFTCATLSLKPLYLNDGVLLNVGSHEVDLALHLLGPAKVLSASVRRNLAGHEDIADFVLLHENGCRSTFHIDLITDQEIREFRIIADDGDMDCNLPGRVLHTRLPDLHVPMPHGSTYYGPGAYDDDYIAEMEDFLYQIHGGHNGRGATGADGLETLKILLEVRKVARLP